MKLFVRGPIASRNFESHQGLSRRSYSCRGLSKQSGHLTIVGEVRTVSLRRKYPVEVEIFHDQISSVEEGKNVGTCIVKRGVVRGAFIGS